MIASLQGTLSLVESEYLVLEVGGVGYQVYVTDTTRTAHRIGESFSLFTHLVVREDSLTLYGFPTRDEVKLFGLLLKVNGVGPRLALETLSTHSPDVIRRAVVSKSDGVFAQVSGIGKKTSQKIILTLEDRVEAGVSLPEEGQIGPGDLEVQEALLALGYSVIEAQTAIQSIPEEVAEDLESQLTAALHYFS